MKKLTDAIKKTLKGSFKKKESKPLKVSAVLGARYAKAASIVLNQEANGACSAMDLKTLQLYQLDGLAAEIFSRIDAKSTAEQICSKIGKKNKIDPQPLMKETEKFVKFLLSKKLIVAVT